MTQPECHEGPLGQHSQLERCLSLDLEVSPEDGTLLALAAHRPDTGVEITAKAPLTPRQLGTLEETAQDVSLLLGHNLIAFDLPHLGSLYPHLKLLDLPAVDTLRLNPLAFPRRPYHRLVKHYKDAGLVRRQWNDPLMDSRLTVEVLGSQLRELQNMPGILLTAWHWLATMQDGEGFDQVFYQVSGTNPNPRTNRAEKPSAVSWMERPAASKPRRPWRT